MNKLLLSATLAIVAITSMNAQIIVSGDITNNTTWTKDNIYILNGWVYVKNNATLTIQAGTLIKGDFNSKGALIIERGSRIMAAGTETEPIVFTSQRPVGQRSFGDWGGLIVCGKASVNVPGGEAVIEGGVGSLYGGGANPDDADNSGVIQYVRIEFGGIPFQPNSEINGLTLGGVGSGTTIDHVQVSYCGDDAFEWFGGTVNAKYLIAYGNWDDDFDTDLGFRGKIQFGTVLRDPAFADQSGSNGCESDNDGSGSGNTPITKPIFSNVTIIGPLANSPTPSSLYQSALHLRRNTRTSTYNSVFVGYPKGLFIDGTAAQSNATSGELQFRNSVLAQMTDTLAAQSNSNNVNGAFNITPWFNTTGFNNQLVNSVNDLGIAGWAVGNPDFRLLTGSMLLSGANFSNANLNNPFFTPTTYRGAFGTTDWTACWAEWDPQSEPYLAATNNTVNATVTPNGPTTFCQGGSVTLSVPAAAEYIWSNGATTQSIQVNASGSYSVTVTNSNKCKGISNPVNITVNALPNATVTPSGSTTFCTGGTVTLTAPSAASYAWNNGATTQSINVTATGSYQVTVTDVNGCSNQSQIVTTSVSSSPAPTIAVGGAATFCDGGSLVLTSSTADSYAWSTGATTQSITVTQAGEYVVAVTNADACDGTGPSDAVEVTVNPSPSPSFTPSVSGGTVSFNNTSTGAATYLWDFGDGILSNQQNPSHTYQQNDNYNVCLTAMSANGCASTECQTVAVHTVGIAEPNEQMTPMRVYPNPTNSTVTTQFTLMQQADLVIGLFDVLGRQVEVLHEGNFGPGTHYMVSDLSSYNSGLYYVVISGSNREKEVQRLLIAR